MIIFFHVISSVIFQDLHISMTSRIYRVWQPGNPKNRIFLPNFWMKLVKPGKNEKLPPNFVKFEIPLEMSSHEANEYLRKIYKLPVCEVQTKVVQGKMIRDGKFVLDGPSRMAGQFGKVMDKEPDKKYAYAVMEKSFNFVFPDLFPKDRTGELSKEVKRQQKVENEKMELLEKSWKRPGETWFGL